MHTLHNLLSNTEIDIIYSRFSLPIEEIYIESITQNSTEMLQTQSKYFQIFFAINGSHINGNDFIENICSEFHNTIIISEQFNQIAPNFIQVPNTNKTMAIIAKKFFNNPDEKLSVISTTGTNGKSTISYLLRHILNQFAKTGLIGTIEYDSGNSILQAPNTTPNAIEFFKILHLALQNGCKYFVTEISSHALDLFRTYGFKPAIAIFTNLTPEHLDFHKTLENYFHAKLKLFSGENGNIPLFSVINTDDTSGEAIYKLINNKSRTITYGLNEHADYKIESINKHDMDGSIFTLKFSNKRYCVSTNLIGTFNMYNIVASIAACNSIGLKIKKVLQAIQNFPGTPGRLQKIKVPNGATIFIDYAHTSDSLEKVLIELTNIKTNKIITVFGCGGDRDKSKRAPMTRTANSLSDLAIATSDNTRSENIENIFSDMKQCIINKSKFEFVIDRFEAIKLAIELSHNGDIILIAGRGHEKIQQIGNKTIEFDDYHVSEQIIKEMFL